MIFFYQHGNVKLLCTSMTLYTSAKDAYILEFKLIPTSRSSVNGSMTNLSLRKSINALVYCVVLNICYHNKLAPFDDGDIVWPDKNNNTLTDHLQILQNKAAEIILDAHPQSSASAGLKTVHWKPLTLRRQFHHCGAILKCLNSLMDFDFNLISNSSFHHYYTRSKDNIHLPQVKTKWGKQLFVYRSTADWNKLSHDTRNSSFSAIFKSKLKIKLSNSM